MSTESSPTTDRGESPTDQTEPVAGCPACGTALERGSNHGHPNWDVQCFVCPDCGMGSAAVVEVTGDLTERTADRLEHARRRATNGLTAFRLAAFCTGDHGTGQYRIQRAGEHAFSVDVPDQSSPWDVLRLAELLSIGPLEAERHTGAIVVRDTRWTTDDTSDEEIVADGGSDIQRIDGSMQTPTPGPFVVSEDDEPRTERAKTEDMDVFLRKTPGRYKVHSASGSYYDVDVLEETCSCPDRAERCKHLRRVDIEINAKLVPRPDGRLP